MRDTQGIYSSDYGVALAPTFYVIDSSGTIRFVKVGGIDVYAILRPQIASLIDLRPSTQLSIQLSSTAVETGSSVTVSGSIMPALSGRTVTITVAKPDGSTTNLSTTTGSGGSYSKSFVADKEGLWKVKAIFAGDAAHSPSESTEVEFLAKSPIPWLLIGVGAVVLFVGAGGAFWYLKLRNPPPPSGRPPPPPPPPTTKGLAEVPPASPPTRTLQLPRATTTLASVVLLGAFAVAILLGANQYAWIQVYVRVLCATCIGVG